MPVSQALIQQAIIEAEAELRGRTSGNLEETFLRDQAEKVVSSAIRLVESRERRRRETELPVDDRYRLRLMIGLSSADISEETGNKIINEVVSEEVY